MTPGLIAAIVALALACAFGLWRRANDGKVRPSPEAPGPDPSKLTTTAPQHQQTHNDASRDRPGRELSGADLGVALGQRATLVQFSSAFCAPCRATRRVLAEVTKLVDGVAHVEIDAESRLDLVRKLDVRRTPTTFVLGPDGHVTHRASGQPRKADVIAALGAVIEFPT